MNTQHTLIRILLVSVLLVFMVSIKCKQVIGNAYIPRSQSLNGPRKITGEIPGVNTHVYMPERTPWSEYDTFMLGPFPYQKPRIQSFVSITPEYQHSFWPSGITQALFGQHAPIRIQGSAVSNRDSCAWLADNFYLPDTFVGTLGRNATIASFIIDINAYIGLPMIHDGVYMRIYAPFVYTKWDLSEKHNNRCSIGTMRGGRMSPDTIAHDQLLANALSFFDGARLPILEQEHALAAPVDSGTIIRHPLRYGKIASHACSGMTRTGFAEIRSEFGYDFWQDTYSHLGLYLAGALPTGTKPNPHYVFAPTIGNGKQFEIGGGVTGHWLFWRTRNDTHQCGIFIDAQATHLCGSRREYQAFDIKNNPMSRYMLAARHEKLDSPGGNHHLGGDEKIFDVVQTLIVEDPDLPRFVQFNTPDTIKKASYRYANEVMPLANLTAQQVLIRTPLQIDATLWFNYSNENISCDFGYNLWLQTRTHTKGCNGVDVTKLTQENWALIGGSELYGYFPSIESSAEGRPTDLIQRTAHGRAVSISASQSQATIRSGPGDATNSAADNATRFAFAQTDPIAWPSRYTVPPQDPFPNPILYPDIPSMIPPGIDGAPYSPLVNFEQRTLNTTLPNAVEKGILAATSVHISMDPVFIRPDDIESALPSRTLSSSHTLFGSVGYTWSHENWEPYLGLGGSIECGSSALSQWGIWLKCAFIFN